MKKKKEKEKRKKMERRGGATGWWAPSDLCKLLFLRLQQSRFLWSSEGPNFTLQNLVAVLYENQTCFK